VDDDARDVVGSPSRADCRQAGCVARPQLHVTRDAEGNWRIDCRRAPVIVKLTASPPKALDVAIEALYGRRPVGYEQLPMRGGVRRFLVRFSTEDVRP
jgi:hypothetical protein